MPDNASEKRDKALDFIVEEYKALWEYYRRTLDEREITLAYDFKSVTIPATALTVVLALNARGGGSQDFPAIVVPANIVAGVFLVLFLLGLTCLFKYGLESENARYFLRSINAIRKFAITEFSPLSHALNVDRVRPGSRPAWLQIPTYGELLICTVNAALAAVAISIVFDTADNTALMRVASLFIGLILIQWASAKMLSSAFRSYEPCPVHNEAKQSYWMSNAANLSLLALGALLVGVCCAASYELRGLLLIGFIVLLLSAIIVSTRGSQGQSS